MRKNLCLIAFMLLSASCIMAQPRGNNRRWANTTSPQIHADNKVTFRYMAPNAKEVKLSGQFIDQPVDMVKNDMGVWEVTVGPIAPDMYPYEFVVDGVRVMDPGNADYFPNENFKGSMLEVKDIQPMAYSIQNVPHGNVDYVMYDSPSIGATGRMLVYTPPGYDANSDKKYPVFYCISGTTDTEEVYFKVGRANFILDNLIASGKAEPMIVVMPYGNPAAYFKPGTELPKIDLFSEMLMKDIIPYVDKNYRTINDRLGRGIGGFSRGGAQALRNGLMNTDRFAWICSYSSGISANDFEKNYKAFYENPDKTNKDMKLLWLGVGNSDFLYNLATDFDDVLTKHRINHIFHVSSGGHTWMNAKLYLLETFQRLFKTTNY